MEVKTEGQRLLREVNRSISKMVNETGVSRFVVSGWRAGRVRPGGPNRRNLEKLYQIPPETWDQKPGGGEFEIPDDEPDREPMPELERPYEQTPVEVRELIRYGNSRKSDPLPTTRQGAEDLLHSLRMTRMMPGITAAEQVKLAAAETRALALMQRMDKESQLSEDTIVRKHPGWVHIRDTIIRALLPFPDAARAVQKALEQLDAEQTADTRKVAA